MAYLLYIANCAVHNIRISSLDTLLWSFRVMKVISPLELESHKGPDTAVWLGIDGAVYDVGEFLADHPGGAEILLRNQGKDCTAAFHSVGHPDSVSKVMEGFCIGMLSDDDEALKGNNKAAGRKGDSSLVTLFAGVVIFHLCFYVVLMSGYVPGKLAQSFVASTAASHPFIEDAFLLTLSSTSVFILLVTVGLFVFSKINVRSSSLLGAIHIHSGWLQIVITLYGIANERIYRAQPGPLWGLATVVVYTANVITMFPLLRELHAPPVVEYLFRLGFSFITSFQGIHAIHWGAEYPAAYWLVMPFWLPSLFKLWESSVFIGGLLPEAIRPQYCARKVLGIRFDSMTLTYVILNVAAAIFDNLYMLMFTVKGMEGFWANSRGQLVGKSVEHWRMRLIKPQTGSLTISVVVFLGTLVYRKKMPMGISAFLNVALASIGPWFVLYWHLCQDNSEAWMPEFGL